jgi:hypothetical protein
VGIAYSLRYFHSSGAIFCYHCGYSHFVTCAQAGVALAKVASLIDHPSLETTRIYIMPGAQDLALAVAAVEN